VAVGAVERLFIGCSGREAREVVDNFLRVMRAVFNIERLSPSIRE